MVYTPAAPASTGPQKALAKLGLARDIDLALHLPLRYEDETRIVKLRDARDGDSIQIEAQVTAKVENAYIFKTANKGSKSQPLHDV